MQYGSKRKWHSFRPFVLVRFNECAFVISNPSQIFQVSIWQNFDLPSWLPTLYVSPKIAVHLMKFELPSVRSLLPRSLLPSPTLCGFFSRSVWLPPPIDDASSCSADSRLLDDKRSMRSCSQCLPYYCCRCHYYSLAMPCTSVSFLAIATIDSNPDFGWYHALGFGLQYIFSNAWLSLLCDLLCLCHELSQRQLSLKFRGRLFFLSLSISTSTNVLLS